MSNSEKQPKFKAGSIVVRTGISYSDGRMLKGKHYIVHKSVGNNLFLDGVYSEDGDLEWFNADFFDLVSEKPKPNYREMQPTDLIKISIDGNESEVPIADLVHAQHLLGIATGHFGGRLWESIWEVLGKKTYALRGKVIDFSDDQKLVLANFFKPYYDKQDEKAKLAELIENKSKELDELKKKLSNI